MDRRSQLRASLEALRRHPLGRFVPFVVVLALVGLVVLLATLLAPHAPFIYQLF